MQNYNLFPNSFNPIATVLLGTGTHHSAEEEIEKRRLIYGIGLGAQPPSDAAPESSSSNKAASMGGEEGPLGWDE